MWWKLSYGYDYFCLCLQAATKSRARGAGRLEIPPCSWLLAQASRGRRQGDGELKCRGGKGSWTLVLGVCVAVMNAGERENSWSGWFVIRTTWGGLLYSKTWKMPADEPCREVLTSSIPPCAPSASPLPPHFCLWCFSVTFCCWERS